MGAIAELNGLRVTVDRLEYSPFLEGNPLWPHSFTYYITIRNDSTENVIIKGRKWVITSASGDVQVYEGDGVVGELPALQPGQQFHYSSYHLVQENSVAEGAYIAQDGQGRPVVTRIPRFSMEIPKPTTDPELAF